MLRQPRERKRRPCENQAALCHCRRHQRAASAKTHAPGMSIEKSGIGVPGRL
jgi:hypothetical protein